MQFLKWFLICALSGGALFIWAQTSADILAEAQKKLSQNDLDGAWDLVQKIAAQQPDSAQLATALGRLDYLRGEFTDAESDFKRALKIDDKFGRAWVGLGRVFESASFREKAKAFYQAAWKADPADPEVQRYYARTLSRAQQLAAYQAYLDKSAGTEDPEKADEIRRRMEELKTVGDRPEFTMKSGVQSGQIKLGPLMYNANIIQGFSLPVSVNGGKPLHLLMDSGASGITINRKAADAVGLRKVTDTKFWGIGDEGDRTGYMALADTVKVGDIEFGNCPVDISEKEFLTDEDGLIGTDVFSKFLVTIDLKKSVVRLDPLPARKIPAADPNWQDREAPPELSHFTPFYRSGHEILLPTRVNGGKPVLFLIDTGSSSTLIDPNYAGQFTGVRSEDLVRMKGVSGRVGKVQSAQRLTYEFGHYRQIFDDVLAVPLGKASKDTPRMTGIFGVPTLINFVLRIDYRDGMLDLEYTGPKY